MKKKNSLLLLVAATTSFAQFTPTPFNPSAEPYYRFGSSLAAYNNNYIVTEIGGSAIPEEVNGKAYLFGNDNGSITQHAIFAPTDLTNGDEFGRSVSLSADFAAIGAPQQSGNGAVYVYHYSSDIPENVQKIQHPDGLTNTSFGRAVKISGDFMFIGAPDEFPTEPWMAYGAVYVYHLNGNSWTFFERLTGTDTISFGWQIECKDGKLVIAGSTMGGSTGFYIFHFETANWIDENAGLIAGNLEANVADWCYDNNHIYMLVQNLEAPSTIEEFAYDNNAGWAYSYLRDCEMGDQWTSRIAVIGDDMFVGSNGYIFQAVRKFPLSHFKKTAGNWMQQPSIYGYGIDNEDDYFGSQLASNGSTLLVGAARENGQSGRAYVVDTALGIKDIKITGIGIYPNPVNDIATVYSDSAFAVTMADIYSITGSQLLHTAVTNGKFSMAQFPEGVYLARLTTANGATKTVKLLKK